MTKQEIIATLKRRGKCLLWYRATQKGYGAVSYRGRLQRVHILMYRWFKGRVPKGKEVCHSCNIKPCAEPRHLYLATHKKNMQDAGRDGLTGGFRKSKLSRADVKAIRGLKNFTSRELAKQFEVSHTAIQYIRRGITWR